MKFNSSFSITISMENSTITIKIQQNFQIIITIQTII